MSDGYGQDFELGNICRFIGQTVTVFTTSGGATGCGFTGVLMSANDCYIRLLTSVGAAPDCPIGSNCCVPSGSGYGGCGQGYGNYGSLLGSVVVIPTDRIVSFVHNAI